MKRHSRVILIELNELTVSLIERFMGEGRLPNFQRFYRESLAFTTIAAERTPNLEPWIQWVTVHTGLDYAEHGLFHLNEGHRLVAKRIWDHVCETGRSAWVCGSMNVRTEPGFKGALLPDPWCTLVPPSPAELGPYFHFVQKSVLEYSNDRVPLSKADFIAFGAFLTRRGLSLRTVKNVVEQLVSERSGHNRWKRAAILDKLQFDIFSWYFRETDAALSTFFLNSTAHYQHSYWRNMDPEIFTVKPTKAEQAEYASAIRFGYEQMDGIVGRMLDLAGRDVTLVFCTALSQQPCLNYEAQGGATFYRPRDFQSLARFAGISRAYAAAPVMTHQFNVDFATEDEARDAAAKLSALRVPAGQVMSVEHEVTRVHTGCQLYGKVPDRTIMTKAGTDLSVRFFDLFYQMAAMKSGMHHPNGILWIRTLDREHATFEDPVPLATVSPTILSLLGVRRPASMKVEAIPSIAGSERIRAHAA